MEINSCNTVEQRKLLNENWDRLTSAQLLAKYLTKLYSPSAIAFNGQIR